MEPRIQVISGADNKPQFVVLTPEAYKRLLDASRPESKPDVTRKSGMMPDIQQASRRPSDRTPSVGTDSKLYCTKCPMRSEKPSSRLPAS